MSASSSPVVSVIIPAYNPPLALFEKCLKSVVDQAGVELEILVVDDGSNAFTANYFDEAECRYSDLQVIHQINGGEGAARNTGLDYAKGKYVVFVDADDALAPNWLTKALKMADRFDASIVMGKVIMVKEVPDSPVLVEDFDYKCFERDELEDIQRGFLVKGACLVGKLDYLDLGVCSKLIRRDCLADLRFPVGIKLSCDQVFNHAMLRRANRYVVTDADAYYYVENQSSVSHVYNPDAAKIMMKSMGLVRGCLFDNPDVTQAFYFRVAMEIVTAIEFAAFSDEHPLSFKEKLSEVQKAVDEPLATEALTKINTAAISDRASRLKVTLLKNRRLALYVFLKQLSKFKSAR